MTGAAWYAGDVDIHNQLHLRIVRSTVAHAKVLSIDVEEARQMPGVAMVLTGKDLEHLGTIPLQDLGYFDEFTGLDPYTHPILAGDKVLYCGQPVAAVIAEDPYVAEDAAELVDVEYEALPAVLDIVDAATTDNQLFPGYSNEPIRIEKSYGDIGSAFERAHQVVTHEYRTGRHSGVPMETRNCVVQPDPGRDVLFIWGIIHVHDSRNILARMLGMPATSIRMRHCEVGGNFGVRGDIFPEYVVAAWAARQLGRPVKWTEDRSEHMVATSHAREQVHRLEVALDESGQILGMRDEIFHSNGAFLRQAEPLVSDITAAIVVGPYRIPSYEVTLHAVMDNKTPMAAYRAPGRYESTFARERIFDLAARASNLSREEFRRRNLLTASDLPWAPGMEMVHEPYHFISGDPAQHLDKALEQIDWDGLVDETAEMRRAGRYVGLGLGMLMDKAGLGLYETGAIEVGSTGRVQVLTGASSVGQGIETVLAQIVADELTISPYDIDVEHSDTDVIPDGVGSWSSRSTVLAGNAAREAALLVVAKARRLAGQMLGAAAEDLVLAGGILTDEQSGQSISLAEISAARDGFTARLEDDEPGLGAKTFYKNNEMNYPYGATVVQMEFDPQTGGHTFLRFFTTSEGGRMINPMTVRGQVIGAAVQGIGGALYEEFSYDDDGTPTATSFMDYLLPAAREMPNMEIMVTEDAPSPDNPLKAKGLGEVGIIAVGAAVASAMDDAFQDDVHLDKLPVPPQMIADRCWAMHKAVG
ncbi:xanthine dehydrogenase family protein molybdopterin-binding subunit [Rhodococcus qingshengii]